jgi:hypothetical protein
MSKGESRDFRDAGDGEENFEPAGEERIAVDALLDNDVDLGDALHVLVFSFAGLSAFAELSLNRKLSFPVSRIWQR